MQLTFIGSVPFNLGCVILLSWTHCALLFNKAANCHCDYKNNNKNYYNYNRSTNTNSIHTGDY